MTGILIMLAICLVPTVGVLICELIEGTPLDEFLTALFPGGEDQ